LCGIDFSHREEKAIRKGDKADRKEGKAIRREEKVMMAAKLLGTERRMDSAMFEMRVTVFFNFLVAVVAAYFAYTNNYC